MICVPVKPCLYIFVALSGIWRLRSLYLGHGLLKPSSSQARGTFRFNLQRGKNHWHVIWVVHHVQVSYVWLFTATRGLFSRVCVVHTLASRWGHSQLDERKCRVLCLTPVTPQPSELLSVTFVNPTARFPHSYCTFTLTCCTDINIWSIVSNILMKNEI